jgi:hypothetical protein
MTEIYEGLWALNGIGRNCALRNAGFKNSSLIVLILIIFYLFCIYM